MSSLIALAPEISEAVSSRRAVVALETTLVTHGLPAPEGLRIALELENLIRREGAVPATCAILDGKIRVGLSSRELERLAAAGASKVNLGNLAAVLASGTAGSTTVAATLAIAHRAGCRVLATGGIGGVHRGATETGDVSADLAALARYPLAVVCSGAKSLLDLEKTVEALETAGVPVLGYRTREFPAFYHRSSGLPVDFSYETPVELGAAVTTHFSLDLRPTAVLVGNPIPGENELPRDRLEEAVDAAEAAARRQGVRGREVTPYLLSKLDELSGGATVAANLALLRSNARLAAVLALEMERPRPTGTDPARAATKV